MKKNSFDNRLQNDLFPDMPASFERGLKKAMEQAGVKPGRRLAATGIFTGVVSVATVAVCLVIVLLGVMGRNKGKTNAASSNQNDQTIQTVQPTESPADWKGTTTEDIEIVFDCTVEVPDGKSFQIAETQKRVFSPEEISNYMDALLPDGERYIELPLTKGYYSAVISDYIGLCRNVGTEADQEYLDQLKKKMEKAPDAWDKKLLSRSAYSGGDSFSVFCEQEDGTYSSFFSDGESGFSYRRKESDGYLDESSLWDNELSILQTGHFADPNQLLPAALEMLSVFSLDDMQLCNTEKLIIFRGDIPAAYGWTFTFTHGTDGLPQYNVLNTYAYGGTTAPAPTLFSPFGQEIAQISVSNDGVIQYIMMQNIVETPKVVLEPVKLCDADTLQKSIIRQLQYTYSYAASMIPESKIIIRSIKLCSALVNVKEHYDTGKLIPAWYVTYIYIGQNQDESLDLNGHFVPASTFSEENTQYYSAIDGTYIEPRLKQEDYLRAGHSLG